MAHSEGPHKRRKLGQAAHPTLEEAPNLPRHKRGTLVAQLRRVEEATGLPAEVSWLVALFLVPKVVVLLRHNKDEITAACFSLRHRGWEAQLFGAFTRMPDTMLLRGTDLFMLAGGHVFRASCLTREVRNVSVEHPSLFGLTANYVFRAEQERGLFWRFRPGESAWYDPLKPANGFTTVAFPAEFEVCPELLVVAHNKVWSMRLKDRGARSSLEALISADVTTLQTFNWPLPDEMKWFNHGFSLYDSPAGIVLDGDGNRICCIFNCEGKPRIWRDEIYGGGLNWDAEGKRIQFCYDSRLPKERERHPARANIIISEREAFPVRAFSNIFESDQKGVSFAMSPLGAFFA